MSTDNKIRKHTRILTVFASNDERVLLKVQPAELNNRSQLKYKLNCRLAVHFVSDD